MDMDDTLVLILERIDSAITLIRAASTCRRWRRVIADAGFLRRHRSLHGPPVAGDYHTSPYDPTPADALFVPSSSSSPIVDARYFSLEFLVDKNIFRPRFLDDKTPSWDLLDSRGSLLLMECVHETYFPDVFPELVVCEPATRRYKIIPKPPGFDGARYDVRLRGPYLVDGDEDAAGGRIGMANFGVSCVFFSRDDNVARTAVFNARANATDVLTTWSDMAIDDVASRLRFSVTTRCLGHVLGSRYFYVPQDGMLITYNGGTGKFSSSVLSRDIKSCWDHYVQIEAFSVVDGGDGEPRIVAMMDHTMEVFGRVGGEWTSENKILLSKVACNLPGYPLSFLNGGLMLIRKGVGFVVMSWGDLEQSWHFSIDLKTMEAAPIANGSTEDMVYRCEFPWPPVLQACLDR